MKFETKNLSVGYNKNIILEDVNLSLSGGDFLEISGENGSGKSTLLETLVKIKEPISGEIITDIRDFSFLPQYTPLIEDLSALDNIILLCGKKYLPAAQKFIEKFSLQEFMKKKISKLSGGTKRKVLLTAILAKDADLLILDEPFSSLDEKSVEVVLSAIENLKAEGKMIILVNHQKEIDLKPTIRLEIVDGKLRAANE